MANYHVYIEENLKHFAWKESLFQPTSDHQSTFQKTFLFKMKQVKMYANLDRAPHRSWPRLTDHSAVDRSLYLVWV